MGKQLLVIDDDPASCRLIKAIFHAEGLEVVDANDGATGIEKARTSDNGISAILLDMHLPDTLGLDVLATLSSMRETASIPVVMLTADREIKSAIRATQLGALDYLTKPVDHDEVVSVVRRALETDALRREVQDLRRQLGEGGGLLAQMGSSPNARDVAEHVKVVAAASRFTVLILGETGTGKELVAQAIHRQSDRRDKPFVALDCGAIPEALLESELFGHERGAFTGAHRTKAGRFELANGGTLFLDEVGNLPMSLQVKLLRALESKQVSAVGSSKVRSTDLDVRFIAATNDDLEHRASSGGGLFRADLYFRLAQYTIKLPPLRERPSDIRFLANKFVEEVGIELRKPVLSIADDAIKLLERQPWPGNVRELRNVVRQAVLRSGDLTIRKDIIKTILTPLAPSSPASKSSSSSPIPATTGGRSLKDIATEAARNAEHHAICEVLRETKGNKSQAARALQTDYKTLHLKIRALGIRPRDFE